MNLQLQKIFRLLIITLFTTGLIQAQENNAIIGKWNIEVIKGDQILPSWLEVKLSGIKALVGSFVGESGSARPISEVFYHDGTVDFSIPPQWDGNNDMHFSAMMTNDKLSGTILSRRRCSNAFYWSKSSKINSKGNNKMD